MPKVKLNVEELDYASDEAYKSLRTNLRFCGEEKKAIVLTSCTPNEGKSTVALYLAMSLVQSGKKVLLLDTDMRKSVLIGNFTVTEELMGLSHFLSGQTHLLDVICNTDVENLDIIFSGPFPPNPAELLEKPAFSALLEYGRENYDYILIDSPPLGSVIDGAIIAQKCDAAVIVLEVETISYRFVLEVKDQLEKSGCPVLGVILNKVDLRDRKYYSYYYSKKYGRHYGEYYGYGNYKEEKPRKRTRKRRRNIKWVKG
ncbi:MAG: polysaccharide biosynthesis tyrosine autokinase [Lachnospiraceae bacterium]|nr:polysaccharide biosynthesis tyrosine autokinase [Lachnospiraceae bacterium]